MKLSEIITQKDGLLLIRHTKGSTAAPYEYDVKQWPCGSKKGWTYLDSFTLSAMKSVYNALNDKNKAKVNNIPLTRYVNFCWEQVK